MWLSQSAAPAQVSLLELALAPFSRPLWQRASSASQPPGLKQSFLRMRRSLLWLCAD